MSGLYTAPAFVIGEILDVMQSRLDAPVVADQGLKSPASARSASSEVRL